MDYLELCGYELANVLGIKKDRPTEPSVVGIIIPGKTKKGIFLGLIWIDNEPRGATAKHWLFEVNGRDNIQMAKDNIAKPLEKQFGVKIAVVLRSGKPQKERISSKTP